MFMSMCCGSGAVMMRTLEDVGVVLFVLLLFAVAAL